MDAAMPEYLWLVIVGAFAAFAYGWGTGANDVANASGTSVGSKAITLRQAVIMAAIFEFSGAILLGRVVTNTIAGGIADPSSFARQPEIYAWGMVCALFVGFAWQAWASVYGLNVSATHSIIGAIIGFAFVYGGAGAVLWARPDPKSFPPYRGVVPIVLSWFVSPLLTGLVSAFIFWTLRSLVLRRQNAANLVFWVLPPAVFFTTFINVFFVFARGAARTLGNTWTDAKAAWVSALIAVGATILTIVVVLPLLKRRAKRQHEQREADRAAAAEAGKDAGMEVVIDARSDSDNGLLQKVFRSTSKALLYGTSVDVHKVVEEDAFVAALHERAEKFDEKAEFTFGYLQVFSAICVIFAHGAGEVGQMAGPLSAIYDIYRNGTLSRSLQPEIWCVFLGAFALVVGLATYGYNVTRTMGVQMAKLSPSRGFAAELATALVILVASQLGLPTSSSQCITGGIVGVGLMEGVMKGVNWKLFGKQFASWVATLFVVCLGSAAIFAVGVFSPSKIDGQQVIQYEDGLSATTEGLVTNFNASLMSFEAAASSGALRNLAPPTWNELNATVADIADANARITDTDSTAVAPSFVLDTLNQALSLFQNHSVFALGQNNIYPGAMACNDNITENIRADIAAACIAPPLVLPAE